MSLFTKRFFSRHNVMASLRCHGDSDCNKTQIIRNFNLHINSRGNLFPISFLTPTYLMLKLGRYPPTKIQSSHFKIPAADPDFQIRGVGVGKDGLKRIFFSPSGLSLVQARAPPLDTHCLCTRLRLWDKNVVFQGGKQVKKIANTSNRGRFCLFSRDDNLIVM